MQDGIVCYPPEPSCFTLAASLLRHARPAAALLS
jgi:hypothetical protein